jgi:predicted TIM-barrel fold metal-dependent hydrolase
MAMRKMPKAQGERQRARLNVDAELSVPQLIDDAHWRAEVLPDMIIDHLGALTHNIEAEEADPRPDLGWLRRARETALAEDMRLAQLDLGGL